MKRLLYGALIGLEETHFPFEHGFSEQVNVAKNNQ
jgi:hypothetical protein